MKKRTAPRIISGSLKGLRLKSIPGNQTRPITDRVKENLFNIIGSDIKGSLFLDAFAGTGSVGIEAMSRGAQYTVFIEKNYKPFLVLSENLASTKMKDHYQLIRTDAMTFLKKKTEKPHDYIFIAPPQYFGTWKFALSAIDGNACIASSDGWIIVQIDPIEDEKTELTNFKEFDRRRYGSTLLIFYEKTLI